MSQQSINPYNLRNNNQVGFGIMPAIQGQTTAGEVVQSTGAGQLSNRLKASKDADPLTTTGLTLGIGYGIGQGMDIYNRNFNKEYSQTITGRVSNWVDKVFENTKAGRYIEKKLTDFGAWTTRKAQTSKIMYALKHHSTEAEWKFAKFFTLGLKGFLGADTEQVLEKFIEKPIGLDFQKLEQYGIAQNEINGFKAACTGTKADKILALQKRELEILGADAHTISTSSLEELQNLAKELKAKKAGFADFSHYASFKGKFAERAAEIGRILENSDKNIVITRLRGAGDSVTGRLKSHFLGRKVGLRELSNKFNVVLGKNNTTHFGRAISKAMAWLTEGCTNRFAGGKLAPLMQATIFADMVYHIWNAPKGEKFQTGAERFVNDFSIFIGGILGAIGMHKIGGWKYIGTNEAGREAYRMALNAHNAQNSVKGFINKAAWKNNLKNNVNIHLNTKDLKWYQKIMQKIGCFVNCGNEHAKPYLSASKINNNLLRRIFNTNIVGVPLRFILPMFIIGPFIGKMATKAVHAIIGRPTVSVLDEEKEEENPQQPENQNPQQPQTMDPTKLPDSNLIKQTITGQNPQQTAQQAVVQDQTDENGNILEPQRSYIPSPVGMVQSADPTAADMAMNNADLAEKRIQEIMGKMK